MIIRFTLFSFFIATVALQPAVAQKKADKKSAQQIQADVTYLASDELEGRRTGTEGERKAADYIEKQYKDADIGPYKNQYRYPFHFTYGKEISGATQIRVANGTMHMNEEAFPLPFSASKHISSEIFPDVMEEGNIWILPLYNDQNEADDPHFDAEKFMYERTKQAIKQGATGILFYDPFGSKWEPSFNKYSEYEPVSVPVAFITSKAYNQYVKQADGSNKSSILIDLNIAINKSERTGNNVAAYIDNKAKYTVVIGAHYDHLGYGEDGNSLYPNATKEHKIHHGADDNASGTAAVLEVAKWVKQKGLDNYNYLFINFSGEELGLYGSKEFIKQNKIDSVHIAYMINMDMVGRLNDSTHTLELGGVGTSPVWAEAVNMAGKDFKLSIDSSGIGPSDHTSFYNTGIPVLFFFTGAHKDYHKPSDEANLVNYPGELLVIKYVERIVAKLDKEDIKPTFTTTKQKMSPRSSFKVTLGIMPDYIYQEGNGLRVDGVSDDRPAQKAGILQGDIITQLGTYKIMGIQSYMEALGKFSPGDKTLITILRNGKEMTLPIVLNK